MSVLEAGVPTAGPAAPAVSRRRVLALHPAWIVVAAVGAVLVRFAVRGGLNTDVFWHVASGGWMLDHHAVIRHDLWSYTVRGRSWVAEEWGFSVLLAWLVRTIGPAGYVVVEAVPAALVLILGVARWRRMGSSPMWAAVLAIGAGMPLAFVLAPRPQMLSYALFAGELLLLQLARRDVRWLAALPPLLLIWANVHGSFLAGLAVLVLELLLARWPLSRGRLRVSAPLPLRPTAAALGASLAATLVNPHGPGLLRYAYHVGSSSQLSIIQEWQPPDLHRLSMLVAVIAPVVVVVAVLALTDVTVEAFDVVLWGALFLATLHSARFLPYMAIAAAGVAAGWPFLRRSTLQPGLAVWPMAALLAVVLQAGPHPPVGATTKVSAGGPPLAATRWLEGRPGRVFSTYAWNDYLIGQGIAVFVDGRTDLYFGTGVLDQYMKVQDLQGNPDPVLERWDVRYVMWPRSAPLSVYLSHDRAWRTVYADRDAVVLEHVTAPPGA